jgi:hypothetical protein
MNHSELVNYVTARLRESRNRLVSCKLGRRLSPQEQRALRADLRMERWNSIRRFLDEMESG